MDILSIMRSRYTTKHYDPSKPVSEEALQTMLEVLRLSPSSVNSQPWHFYVIESAEAKAKLMPAVKDFNIERMKAPVFILFTVSTKLGPQYWEALYQQEDADGRFAGWTSPERPDAIRMMAAERLEADPAELFLYNSNQAYLALGCLTVAAETLGVDSTILGGLDFDQVDEIFGFGAKNEKSIVAIALGHRAKDDANAQRPKSRWPAERVITRL